MEEGMAVRQHALDIERFGEDEIVLVDLFRRSAARNLVAEPDAVARVLRRE